MPWARLGAVVLVGAVCTLLVLVIRAGGGVPDEPQPVEWNNQPCAHCQMLVGDPSYAAQLITADGDVLDFDDPGCVIRYVDRHHPTIHRLWFHIGPGDRWVPADEVRFVPDPKSPMGTGLRAVEPGSPNAIDYAAATRRVVEEASR